MAKQDTEVAVSTTPAVEFDRYSPLNMQTWEQANEGALELPGYDLLKDGRQWALENVPFLIVGATYRPGVVQDKRARAYISVECVVAPAPLITRRGVDPGTLPFSPGDHIVFNDGTTGVCRQVTKALSNIGWIVHDPNIGREGDAPMGESIHDQPPAEWADVNFGDLSFDEDGRGIYSAPIRLRASRGLRLSRYTNEYTGDKEAVTPYLA